MQHPSGYVVDFYDGQQTTTHPVSIHIDARPEVSIQGLQDRLWRWWKGWGTPEPPWPPNCGAQGPKDSSVVPMWGCPTPLLVQKLAGCSRKESAADTLIHSSCLYVTEEGEVDWYIYIYHHVYIHIYIYIYIYTDSGNTAFDLQTSLSFLLQAVRSWKK